MLHPNLVQMDAQTELTDKTRWMKMEPPDVIAQIMSLDLTNAASRVAFTTSDEQDDKQLDLLDKSLWYEAKEENEEFKQTTKPPNKPTVDVKKEHVDTDRPYMITNIMMLHKALKSGTEVLVGDDVWDAGTEPTFSSTNNENITTPSTADQPINVENMSSETKLLLAALKREVLLLRNELNFELFLKQQHLQHIGRLHREHVLDTSVEAERQQLVTKRQIVT